MHKRRHYKVFRFTAAVLFGSLCLTPPVHHLAAYPSDIQVPLGEQATVPIALPMRTTVFTSDPHIVDATAVYHGTHVTQAVEVRSRHLGDATVSTRLFGMIPWKAVHVHVVPEELVYVGGQSIGVRLRSNGVLVIGYQRLPGTQHAPAAEAHIQIGDVIEQIDHHTVVSVEDVHRWLNLGRGTAEMLIRHGTQRRTVIVTPVTDATGARHLGLYVRDRTAGIGTLTFYDPVHHRFGALGHVITDVDTGQPIDGSGAMYEAEVTGIVRGTNGRPGEKRGRFVRHTMEIGQIERNSSYGVFGAMDHIPGHAFMNAEIPVALPDQVHEGAATMLTVLHGQQVAAYAVSIENLVRQTDPNTKSMIVHVTDPRLLEEAGGIVQGMSGSPLIQDGRLIGAVTHVFLSDVTRGYGVYAQWMVREAESEDDVDARHSTQIAWTSIRGVV